MTSIRVRNALVRHEVLTKRLCYLSGKRLASVSSAVAKGERTQTLLAIAGYRFQAVGVDVVDATRKLLEVVSKALTTVVGFFLKDCQP